MVKIDSERLEVAIIDARHGDALCDVTHLVLAVQLKQGLHAELLGGEGHSATVVMREDCRDEENGRRTVGPGLEHLVVV